MKTMPPPPTPSASISTGGEDEAVAERQRDEFLANAETWYKLLKVVLQPMFRRYSIPYILSITEFMKAMCVWLDGFCEGT